jgi:hypothetical protein
MFDRRLRLSLLTIVVLSTAFSHAHLAARPAHAESKLIGQTFLETFDGQPESPDAWLPDDWDVTIHSRNRDTHYALEPMDAMHGPDCSAPPATHRITRYEDAVFQCRDHLMTAIKGTGYAMIYLTPNHMVDFGNQTGVISFDVSTLRGSTRDWFDIWISPFNDNLQLALDDGFPDVAGEPRRGINIRMDEFNGRTVFRVDQVIDHKVTKLTNNSLAGLADIVVPDAKRRDRFEIHISRTHVKFGMPEYDVWWFDGEIEPLDWTQGVIQIGHHSYNPLKNCPECHANTWHWDNVSITPAVPFTMIRGDKRSLSVPFGDTITFVEPSPKNAYLRFAGIGSNIELSYDNGKSWKKARLQMQEEWKFKDENFKSYFTPIPQGVSSVKFRGEDWFAGEWIVRDVTIWSNNEKQWCSSSTAATSAERAPSVAAPQAEYMLYLPAIMTRTDNCMELAGTQTNGQPAGLPADTVPAALPTRRLFAEPTVDRSPFYCDFT